MMTMIQTSDKLKTSLLVYKSCLMLLKYIGPIRFLKTTSPEKKQNVATPTVRASEDMSVCPHVALVCRVRPTVAHVRGSVLFSRAGPVVVGTGLTQSPSHSVREA